MQEIQKDTSVAEVEDRSITFVISDESVDRAGDIVKVDGWDLTNFLKNPVLLLQHKKKDELPIARFTNVWKDGTRLMGTAQFPTKGTYDKSDIVYELYKQKVLNAVSVGFRSSEYTENEHGGSTFTKQELVEVSAVSVPANTNALALVKALNPEKFDLIEKQVEQANSEAQGEAKATPDDTAKEKAISQFFSKVNKLIDKIEEK